MNVDEYIAQKARIMRLDEIDREIKQNKDDFFDGSFSVDVLDRAIKRYRELLNIRQILLTKHQEVAVDTFVHEFAMLSQRIQGAKNDASRAMKVHNNLSTKRDDLIMANHNDLKIGVYDVPGGHVVISGHPNLLSIVYYGDDDE